MKKINIILKSSRLLLLSFTALALFNCSKNDEPTTTADPIVVEPVTLNSEINDFIWRGLNEIYLWQEDVPNLSDTKFFSNSDYVTFYNNYGKSDELSQDIVKNYFTFLNDYNTPESLFDDLLYQKDVIDRFSWIEDDYVALENFFQGNSNSNGLDFGLVRLSGSDDVFGYVRYLANNSDASGKDIHRGDFFLTVNGQQLNVNNYANLLFGANNTYTLGMANITNNAIALNGKVVELTKTNFTESPILVNKVIDVGGIKVGYLMYNQFLVNFELELNNVFSQFKAEGIDELVLDLRYNLGGNGYIAVDLASMITGQFEGEIFYKEQWNSKYQAYFEANAPEILVNPFVNELSDGTPINSLNLNKVYILTTDETASSSELMINGLNPYIDVIQIGTNTTGKFHGSVTLYDSPNFEKTGANPNHKYAMQPLVIKATNVNGVSDYYDGLVPDYLITYNTSAGTVEGENLLNLGTLGDANEPFLAKALELITGTTTKFDLDKANKPGVKVEPVASSKDFNTRGSGLIVDFKQIK
ncbi:S41 family peptidase [Confluentibacter flavum]|uniref:Peptidase S41 n=1 Tax=Confluentibacter flavum TaxID=1909700 RepID=A0A2N3HN67_9FLAO|nr:S41 family peptidase [Confluentibacter flavum]PKQ46324.1 peptidase S41 [Confluentibacter flavum]